MGERSVDTIDRTIGFEDSVPSGRSGFHSGAGATDRPARGNEFSSLGSINVTPERVEACLTRGWFENRDDRCRSQQP